MKIDASHHDYALDNMHEDVELAPNQVEEVEFLKKWVNKYKIFIIEAEHDAPLGYCTEDFIKTLDEITFMSADINDYISIPEYPDREPS